MSKRYTATEKWSRPWFRKLPSAYKLLWMFVIDECDIAGVWRVDMDMACFKTGCRLDYQTAILYLGKQIISLDPNDNGDRWFIKDYCSFQYSKLNPTNLFHRSVISMLENDCVPIEYYKGLLSSSEGSAKSLSTNTKEKRKKEESNLFGSPEHRQAPHFAKPNLVDVRSYCIERGNHVDPMKFIAYYESNGWRVGRNPMRNWKAAIITWEKNDNAKDSTVNGQPISNGVISAAATKQMLKEIHG